MAGLNSGQPGWLAHIDRSTESLFLHHGTTMAILLAVVCLVVAAGVFLPAQVTQGTVVLAVVVFAVIWVAVQDFGGILAGGATDPNCGAAGHPAGLDSTGRWRTVERAPPAPPMPVRHRRREA